jgi:hypothetical protein
VSGGTAVSSIAGFPGRAKQKFLAPPFFKKVGFFLFFFFLIFICYPGLFLHFSTGLIRGDAGDLQNILGVISHSIEVPLTQLYHLPIFYPQSYMLVKTHPLFGVSIFFYLFKLLGFSLVQSTNLYIILCLMLGAWGTFLLAKEFVQKPFFPLLFSTLYILHPLNHLHFVWLNFLTRFYLPFIILFLIRYFKTRKKSYAAAAVIFSFLQFLASVYYGVLVWAVIIPVFLFFALLLKIISFRQLRFLFLCLVVVGLLILLIFYPYISRNAAAAKHFDDRLTQVEELFSVSKVFSLVLGAPGNISQYLFPGILFTAFGMLFFVGYLPRQRLLMVGILLFFLLLMCSLVYASRPLLNLVFLAFLIFLFYLAAREWKTMDQWIKLLLLTFGFMFLFLFHFTYPAFLKSLAPYRLFYVFLPVGGLTVIKRTFLFLLPFFIVLAVVGASRFFQGVYQLKPSKKYLIFAVLLVLMVLENVRSPVLYLNNKEGVVKPLPQVSEVYGHLPFKGNKVVLEIPFYFRRRLKNTYYMLNWRFHQNALLNGKVTLFPKKYYQRLSGVIGKFQQEFPAEEGLKKLLHDYSVSYIVIHWDLLKEYQQVHRTPVAREEILRRIKHLDRYLEIIAETPGHMVLKLRENFPLKEIIRTYSYYHLKNHKIKIAFTGSYDGMVRVFLNDQFFKTLAVRGSVIEIDLRDAPLLESRNNVRFQFESSGGRRCRPPTVLDITNYFWPIPGLAPF